MLTSSRRRCCLCVFLDGKDAECHGQIAHVDRDRSNAAFKNLAYLCLDHHDRYDGRTSQSKGFTPSELAAYRDDLYRRVTAGLPLDNAIQDYGLKVRATPLLNGAAVWIEFRVENTGKRPLRLNGWRMRWTEDGSPRLSESVLPIPPVLMRERDECRFSVDLGVENPTSITEIGLLDSDNKLWTPDPGWVEQIADVVNRAEMVKHLLPPEVDPIPEDASGQSVSVVFATVPSGPAAPLCLVVRVTNTGASPLPILRGYLEWEFVKPRGTGKARQIGGSVQAPSPIGAGRLKPGETTEFRIDREWTGMLVEAASLDVDRKKLRFVVITSRRAGWVCTEDGLPEAVEQVARSVMAGRKANGS